MSKAPVAADPVVGTGASAGPVGRITRGVVQNPLGLPVSRQTGMTLLRGKHHFPDKGFKEAIQIGD